MTTKCELGVIATSGGCVYNLNELCGFYLSEIDGLGIAETLRLFQKSPQQVGVTDSGFDIDARFILGTWAAMAGTNPDLWGLKETFHGIFRPRTNDPVQIIFSFPDKTRRAADVYLEGQANFTPAGRLDGVTHQIGVVLKAEDPRLYDPKQKIISFSIVDRTGGWRIDTVDPALSVVGGWQIETDPPTTQDGWQIGASVIASSQTFLYANGSKTADVEFPIVRLTGPMSSPVVRNTTTDEKIDLSDEGGLFIPTGRYVDIDLRFRSGKSITFDDGTFADQYLTDDSDLDSFHFSYNTELLPEGSSVAPDAYGVRRSTGSNTIQVNVVDANALSRVDLIYYDRYVGKG